MTPKQASSSKNWNGMSGLDAIVFIMKSFSWWEEAGLMMDAWRDANSEPALRDMADAPMDGTSIDLYVKINGSKPFRLADCNNEGKGWVFNSGLSILHHYKGKKVELLGWMPILEVTK
jgi:hypothetical protein